MTNRDAIYAEAFEHGRQFESVVRKTRIGGRLEADLMGITAQELKQKGEQNEQERIRQQAGD